MFFWCCLFIKMTAMKCWHCCLMTTETLSLSDTGGKLKLLKIILGFSDHEMTQYSDFESFRYFHQEWSLLPLVIKQFRPSITLACCNLGKAHISRRCKITTLLCFVIQRQLNMWKRKQKMPFPSASFYTQSPLPSLCSRIWVLHPHNSQEITLPQEEQIWFLPSCLKINFSIL